MSQNATNMRKLMESVNPVQHMEMSDIPVDNMGAIDNNGDMDAQVGGDMAPDMGMDAAPEAPAPDMGMEMPDMGMDMAAPEGASSDIIDALDGEFKRLTTEFLQTGGELDEAGLGDVREKLGKHMTSILDVLHSGWMDNMMDQGANEEAPSFGGDSDGDAPDFSGGDSDDSDDSSSDDDSGDSDDKAPNFGGDDSDDSGDDEEKDSDDSDDDKSDDDDGDKEDKEVDESENPLKNAHINESTKMRNLQNIILNG